MEASWVLQIWSSPAGLPGILPVGLHHPRQNHWGRICRAPSLPSTPGCSLPKGMVGPG